MPIDAVQTQLARGYKPVGYIGHLVFPWIRLTKVGGQIPEFGKDNFKHHNTRRAKGADRNQKAAGSPVLVPYSMNEEDFSVGYDLRDKDEMSDVYSVTKLSREESQDVVMLTHEKMCAEKAIDEANYAAGNVITLSGNSQFSDYVNSDPIAIFKQIRKAVSTKIGRKVNFAWMDDGTYECLISHPKLKDAFSNVKIEGELSKEQLMKVLKVKELAIGEAVELNEDDELVPVWGANMGFAYKPAEYLKDEPKTAESVPYFGYSLGKKGYPQADKWKKEGNKVENIGVTDIYDVVVLGKDAAGLIKNTHNG